MVLKYCTVCTRIRAHYLYCPDYDSTLTLQNMFCLSRHVLSDVVFIACEDVTYVCNMVAQVTVNRFRSSVSSDKQTVVHHAPLTHVINYSVLSRDVVCLFELHTDSLVIFVLFASSCSSIWCPNTSSLIINSMCCVYPSVPFSVDPARRGESSSTVLKNNYTVRLLW